MEFVLVFVYILPYAILAVGVGVGVRCSANSHHTAKIRIARPVFQTVLQSLTKMERLGVEGLKEALTLKGIDVLTISILKSKCCNLINVVD